MDDSHDLTPARPLGRTKQTAGPDASLKAQVDGGQPYQGQLAGNARRGQPLPSKRPGIAGPLFHQVRRGGHAQRRSAGVGSARELAGRRRQRREATAGGRVEVTLHPQGSISGGKRAARGPVARRRYKVGA